MHPNGSTITQISEIKITKATEVSLVFIKQWSARMENTIGYFTYPTNEVPTESTVQKSFAFLNASPSASQAERADYSAAMKWNWNIGMKSTQQFEDKFPAGGLLTGWCLEGMGFNNGNIKKTGHTPFSLVLWTVTILQRCGSSRWRNKPDCSHQFEDNTDYDYCDATFYVKIAEANAIDPEGPELPPGGSAQQPGIYCLWYTDLWDQWPSEGDYDMNDVVIEYQSTIYKSALDDKIYKIMDEFTPYPQWRELRLRIRLITFQYRSVKVKSFNVSGSDSW